LVSTAGSVASGYSKARGGQGSDTEQSRKNPRLNGEFIGWREEWPRSTGLAQEDASALNHTSLLTLHSGPFP
jgi:hypothetical protein